MVVPSRSAMPAGPDNSVQLGLTYSAREARYRNLPWQETFDAALDAAPSLVRLGAYWNEIEPAPGDYDFSNLDWLLDQAEARQQRVLLTVGMKAPRWPEYYLPRWLTSGKRLSSEFSRLSPIMKKWAEGTV